MTLRHAPDLKRSAAALRVAAGSHDVPLAWPGLAHFLEHLLFLGTERFPASQALMAYVQGHGGQVNARTSERTTDYFFELPPLIVRIHTWMSEHVRQALQSPGKRLRR